jgi:hypothetical protein
MVFLDGKLVECKEVSIDERAQDVIQLKMYSKHSKKLTN